MSSTAVAAPVPETMEQAFILWAGGMPWAASAAAVQSIFRVGAITRVPLAPPVIAGLVNLRGRVVVAVSLAQRLFGTAAPREAMSAGFGIAVEHGGDLFALLAEDVGDVLTLASSDRVALPPHAPVHLSRLTSACFRTSRGIIPLLDIGRLLAIEIDRRSGLDRRASPSPQSGAKP